MLGLHSLSENFLLFFFAFVRHHEKDRYTGIEHFCPQVNYHVNIEGLFVITWIIQPVFSSKRSQDSASLPHTLVIYCDYR